MSNIYLNGEPMIWITADEAYDPETGDCAWIAVESNFKDYLMPLRNFNGSVPADYWDE
jgi:hypothetical protein